MGLAQCEHRFAKRVEVVRMSPLTDDDDVVQGGRGANLDVAEVATHPIRDVSNGRLERRIARRQRVAVDVSVLARRPVRLVLVDQLVAARRLANCAVLQGFYARREAHHAGRDDESEPERDGSPRAAHAPAGDPRDGTHAPSLRHTAVPIVTPTSAITAPPNVT